MWQKEERGDWIEIFVSQEDKNLFTKNVKKQNLGEHSPRFCQLSSF